MAQILNCTTGTRRRDGEKWCLATSDDDFKESAVFGWRCQWWPEARVNIRESTPSLGDGISRRLANQFRHYSLWEDNYASTTAAANGQITSKWGSECIPAQFNLQLRKNSYKFCIMHKKVVCILSKRKPGVVYQFPKPVQPPPKAA